MGPTGAIVRKLDRLGRLVLPREMLHLMDISDGDPLEALLDGDRIVLRKYQPGCIFCGKTEDAHILDGDVVILEHIHSVENGQMAAVWLRNEQQTTLKKVYHEGHRIRLQTANRTTKPIYPTPDNVDIQGRVVAVIRKFEA